MESNHSSDVDREEHVHAASERDVSALRSQDASQVQEPLIWSEGISSSQFQKKQKARSIGSIVLSVLLYLWGVYYCVLGYVGLVQSVVGKATPPAFVEFMLLVLCILSAILLIIILIRHKQPRLRWLLRLLAEVAVTGFGVIALIIGSALTRSTHLPGAASAQENLVLGCVCLFFGIVIAVLALW